MQYKLLIERTQNNLKKKDIAQILKISPESYSAKEKGTTQFKADEMFILSDYFGKSLDEIFLPRNFEKSEITK